MAEISYIHSLMEFNKRVLYTGDLPNEKVPITLDDLKQKLFFNQVFLSNTSEMFQKYQMTSLYDEYVELINHYMMNVIMIANKVMSLSSNKLNEEDSFERRLSTFTAVQDSIISKEFDILHEASRFDFKQDTIYYLTPIRKGVVISYIDPKRAPYKDGISTKTENGFIFHKVDLAIKAHISDEINLHAADTTVAIRVVRNETTDRIALVEFNGAPGVMESLLSIFPSNALIMSNLYIYTNDIMQMIDNAIAKPSTGINKPSFNPISAESIFSTDRLLEFPRDSFDQYLNFLWNITENEMTKEIYMTIYRIGDDPSLFYVLRHAKEKGIYVHVNVELYATGEKINWFWYNECARAGIKVTSYARGNLKVHSKLTLIKFKNGMMIAQIGTGNYHIKTTKQYTDLCLLTSDFDICNQVLKVFEVFRGEERTEFNRKLLVTRYNAKDSLINLIYEQGELGPKGYIAFKCNSLDDPNIIAELERAAMNGCFIDLVVRGVCTWVPQNLPNVKIKSIIWDKLEHSRVYCFGRTDPIIYMGSLDPVTHKLNKRIETLVRVYDPDIVLKVCNYVNKYVTNIENSWVQTESSLYAKEVK